MYRWTKTKRHFSRNASEFSGSTLRRRYTATSGAFNDSATEGGQSGQNGQNDQNGVSRSTSCHFPDLRLGSRF